MIVSSRCFALSGSLDRSGAANRSVSKWLSPSSSVEDSLFSSDSEGGDEGSDSCVVCSDEHAAITSKKATNKINPVNLCFIIVTTFSFLGSVQISEFIYYSYRITR